MDIPRIYFILVLLIAFLIFFWVFSGNNKGSSQEIASDFLFNHQISPTVIQIQDKITGRESFSSLRYPNSIIIGSYDNNLVFKTEDNVEPVTNWYQDKIKGLGLKTLSFLKTNTNGNILNKIAATDGTKEISVEISNDKNLETRVILKANF